MPAIRTSAIVATLILASMNSAQGEEDIQARVIVPDAPKGAVVSGCYAADRNLYGPYRLRFCLRKAGTYTIRGGGVKCDGRLTWDASGRTVYIWLQRQSCGKGVAWEEASIDCRGMGVVGRVLNDLIDGNVPKPRVLVPDTPRVRALSCEYFPTVRGEKRRHFVANRD